MTSPVDVLAVLAPLAADATKKYGPDNQYFLARAALSNLIVRANALLQLVDEDGRYPRTAASLYEALERVQGREP